MRQVTTFAAADQFLPNDADWAEFVAWAEEQDATQADLDQLPEPTPAAWSAHVADYLTAHNLAAVPF